MINQYRFSQPKDDFQKYSTGASFPHRHQDIERWNGIGWEVIGYIEIHLHKVKLNSSDIEDISAGITVRINPKNEPRPI